ncbi:MAG: hypothetical protein LBC84_00715 [Prevotellaceae bacterium]|nr:hypothetical protein [Prevotellaceae bacterium]
MMKTIFENKKSPFYHFGQLCTLDKIPYEDFYVFLLERFTSITDKAPEIATDILAFSSCHPHYTQQLAFHVWMALERSGYTNEMIHRIIADVISLHDNDFERLWRTFNNTDKGVLIELAFEHIHLQSYKNAGAPSTIFSALKRLTEKGVLIKTERYRFDDPFFREWIVSRRMG